MTDEELEFLQQEGFEPSIVDKPPEPLFWITHLLSGGDITKHHVILELPHTLYCAYAEARLSQSSQAQEDGNSPTDD